MIVEYLEKTKEDFVNQKDSLLSELNEYENRYKENIKMIQLLEEKMDTSYESFTPREVNSYNKDKIKELSEEQKKIDVIIQEKRKDISDIEAKIDEISSVIKVASEGNSLTSNNEEVKDIADVNIMLLETVERERQRIARDLHDSTVQNLTSLVHKSELCIKLMDADPIRCKLELSSMNKILRDVINNDRKIIYDLRPMSFDDIGFDITVERLLDKIKQSNGIRCNYKIVGESFVLKSVISLTLLRIIQESCSNSVKHGHATSIDVILEYTEDKIILTIQDNGEGFDTSLVPETIRKDNSGFGISMMKERVFLLSGKIDIKSKKGNGCITQVEIPVKKEDM
ncbi:MAG: histidine kinase [Agathobacter sp.]|nr:histidine kinase [Agathobacter sp.]